MNITRFQRRCGRPMMSFGNEFGGLFDRFFDHPGLWGTETSWAPAIDIAQNDDAVTVRAEVPGLTAEEITLSVQDDTLTISGEKKDSSEQSKENYYHVERSYGRFQRVLTLPTDIDAEKIEATCKDGVLTVRLPKAERVKPRKIAVTGE